MSMVLFLTYVVYIMKESLDIIKEKVSSWQDGMAKNITFIVTKDCQLACKYCYLVGKNSKERMSFEIAKQAIDYILDHEDDFREQSVVWDFIGGEPFMEIDLIDRICDYLKAEMFRRNHHWFNSYRFSFSTNGINYHTDKVQAFIKKNASHLSIGITIDGTKQKHDLNRIYKQKSADEEERGSYEDVVKNIPLWTSQFPGSGTKVTISSADIPYIKESVLHLYSLGIHEVNINCVFEDVWKEGDDLLFEDQLMQLADAIIDGDYGAGMTVTSAMKGLAPTVRSLLTAIVEGGWDSYKGQVQTLGLVSENPEENFVQLPASTQFEDGKFTADDYKDLVSKMFKGEIKVSNSIEAMPETQVVKVDDQGKIKG